MKFLYLDEVGGQNLVLDSQNFNYLIKVRRTKIGEILSFRNPAKSEILWRYKLVEISKKSAVFDLVDSAVSPNTPHKFCHIIWAVVDVAVIEKTLPMLNEMGVSKLSFFYADFSQKNFKLNEKRIEAILKNSSQQSGRSNFLEIEILENLDAVLSAYPTASILDFNGEVLNLQTASTINFAKGIIIGPEAGFSQTERKKFTTPESAAKKSLTQEFDEKFLMKESEESLIKKSNVLESHRIFTLDSNFILRSQTAATFIASIAVIASDA